MVKIETFVRETSTGEVTFEERSKGLDCQWMCHLAAHSAARLTASKLFWPHAEM